MNSPWNKELQILVVLLVGLNLAPLLNLVPIWVSLIALILVIWKLLHLFRGVALPPNLWVKISAGLMVVLICINRRSILGQDAGTDLLVLFASYKLIETHRYRDVMVNAMICFFLLTITLLNSQSLFTSGFLLLDIFLITWLLLKLHPSADSSLTAVKSVLKLGAFVLPICATLFVLFPRFTVGFMPREHKIGIVGFTDEISPGDISQIARTSEIAFRVRFENDQINPSDLYWRGAVLTRTQRTGLKWTKIPNEFQPPEFFIAGMGHGNEDEEGYEVFLEPLFNHWLFKLDYPVVSQTQIVGSNAIVRRPGLIYEFQRDVASRIAYRSEEHKLAPVQRLTKMEHAFYLDLPQTIEPEVKALAKKLRDPKRPAQSVQNLLDWFQTQHFHYTLEPGAVPGGTLTGFLFKSKIGFCEHYAAASGVILRAMGIPARIVLGFQGGEKNDLGDYWIVKSSHAHAWNEVWVPIDGNLGRWTRFDAVSVVAPLRTRVGTEYFNLSPAALLSNDPKTMALEFNASGMSNFQNKLHLAWDALEMQWGSFLLLYDFEFQKNMMTKLGFQNTSRGTFFLGLFLVLSALIISFTAWMRRRERVRDPVLEIWRSFVHKMEKMGIVRSRGEGPLDFVTRATQAYPEKAEAMSRILDLYLGIRYQQTEMGVAQKKDALKREVRNFS